MSSPRLFPALQITSACNKRCKSCLRPSGEKPRKMSEEALFSYLSDLSACSASREIKYQFVTGGEPTLWRDSGLDIVDALAAFHGLDCIGILTMPTNGKRFEDLDYTRDFIGRLSKKASRPTVIGVSIATYQENLTDSGYTALDNLLSVCADGQAKAVPIILVTLSVDDDTYDRLDKIYPQVYKRVTALAPLGVASRSTQCPGLDLGSSDKAPLGAFLPHFKRDVMGKLRLSESEFYALSNDVLLDRLSLFNNCGDSPFIDDRWHYCLPYREDARFDLGPVGAIEADCFDRFLQANPVIRAIRENGIVTAARAYRHALSASSAEKLDGLLNGKQSVSVAYRGCMLCKKLGEIGVMDELLEQG